ncbi:hypothetical protein [Chamaesiphon sp. VAR_69_metabat_338]|uniref:hypothetical protein n=1 Tax=Chamaesiphon sp. VAR_69_metabat_338 TaxID=2964704 RepID=UPI00286E3BC8|nr:hypothetical protein [Chamaesiphon sp. VAR_69_metabat_338]
MGFAQVQDFFKTAENPVLGFAQVQDFFKAIVPAKVAIQTRCCGLKLVFRG